MTTNHLILIFYVTCFLKIQSQIVAISDNSHIEISSLKQLAQSSQSLLTCVTFTPTSIWTMTSNNSISIINKSNLSVTFNQSVQNSSDFIFENTEPLSMIVFDEDYATMAVTGVYNSSLVYYFYRFNNATIPSFQYSLTFNNHTSAPFISFLTNSAIYSFYSNFNSNDTVFIVKIIDNSTSTITLPTSNSSLAVSPNKKNALVWTPSSSVYIYSIDSLNFTLLQIYNGSFSTKDGTTDSITFSSDGTLAIIETDKRNQIRILNLTSLLVIKNITFEEADISSIFFLDVDNRFLLINCKEKTYLYDLNRLSLKQFQSKLSADAVIVDQNGGKIITTTSSSQNIMGVTIGNSSSNGSFNNGSSNNGSSNNSSSNNSSSNNSLSNYNSSNNSSSNNSTTVQLMSYTLQLTEAQNATFAGLKSASTVVLNIMTNFNLVVYSSPFACFFLGFFNYFTLNSMYILLNIQLPDIIFQELSNLYASSNMNLLTSFGINFAPPSLSDELVNQYRAIYFGISSDIFSSNYYPFGLVFVNILLFELIMTLHRHIPKKNLAHSILKFKRAQIFFGFGVYLMAGIALPWKFVIFSPALNLSTKINSASVIILLVCVTFFLAFSLISFLDIQEKKNKKGKKCSKQSTFKKQQCKSVQKKKKKQLSEWMIAYQNLIYPLLVLISNCMFFLIIVLLSKIIELIIFIKHSTQRKLTKYIQIASFVCEIIYHCTFFIFARTKDEEIIIYNSLICMGFFYLGAVFNLLWVVIYFVSLIRKICISCKPRNKVNHHDLKSNKEDKEEPISPILLCESWTHPVDRTVSFGKASNEDRTFAFKMNTCMRNNKKVRTPLQHLKITIA